MPLQIAGGRDQLRCCKHPMISLLCFPSRPPGTGAKYQGYCVYIMFFACLFMRYILNEMMMVKKNCLRSDMPAQLYRFPALNFFCCRQPRSWPTMGFPTSMCSILRIFKKRMRAKQRLVICLST